MTMVDARSALGVLALVCALALTGCTPDGPAEPTPSPTPASQTPTETAQEKQERLDYAAAEKSYRIFRAEFNRVMRRGGASTPTSLMNRTAGGSYLKEFADIIEAYRGLKLHTVGSEAIVFVRPDGYSPSDIELEVCEDSRSIQEVDSSGKRTRAGEIRTASLQVKRTTTGWKVWSGQGRKVSECS
ncbi:hypothetical protein [uncultured Friedmanniella sp.]|uniref:hypothetical protein n=1 Tax=uncultured Friedmanniella sp. TaxID=335381 RepID=UPI0035CB2D84